MSETGEQNSAIQQLRQQQMKQFRTQILRERSGQSPFIPIGFDVSQNGDQDPLIKSLPWFIRSSRRIDPFLDRNKLVTAERNNKKTRKRKLFLSHVGNVTEQSYCKKRIPSTTRAQKASLFAESKKEKWNEKAWMRPLSLTTGRTASKGDDEECGGGGGGESGSEGEEDVEQDIVEEDVDHESVEDDAELEMDQEMDQEMENELENENENENEEEDIENEEEEDVENEEEEELEDEDGCFADVDQPELHDEEADMFDTLQKGKKNLNANACHIPQLTTCSDTVFMKYQDALVQRITFLIKQPDVLKQVPWFSTIESMHPDKKKKHHSNTVLLIVASLLVMESQFQSQRFGEERVKLMLALLREQHVWDQMQSNPLWCIWQCFVKRTDDLIAWFRQSDAVPLQTKVQSVPLQSDANESKQYMDEIACWKTLPDSRSKITGSAAYKRETSASLQCLESIANRRSVLMCRKCKSTDVSSMMIQTRSADEGMTTFFECNACHCKWKEQ